ncbi:hypothetical protein NBRC3280_2898 [Acetobacter pasteurianus NBRC 3280]|uniref:Phage tail lysozyme domain-containing protein n=1 Tax=Acetobacter pasteurianus NBRC 3278 TaxID=1226660 RepID=A0A401X7L1_ACEPA|nr:hypothetical protein [Acetobacter pasteurianus]GCD60280.1 hypothetical protein NBRC3277_2855 [Acetobacter pasteurianus NBRC 3277]GCD63925.1 hypothetical protein NBRC3278_3018 [Acetobacter pasteurianus NBRC 3278]GCD70263.1 hypothetical protein NBRC3280_2898 [Acetobacter pasteurianus NBRC 3280]
MATVVDAFVVELGLDPKALKKGAQQAQTLFGNVTAGAGKMSAGVSKATDTAADSFRHLERNALAFLAVLTGGKALKAFVSDTTASNVAAGQLARNLGTSVNTLTTWQKVAEAAGGSASDMSSSLGSLVSQFQTIDGRRNLGMAFGQMGVRLEDAHGKLRDFNALLPDMARAAQRLGPQLFSTLAGQAGFSQGAINMLELGPKRIEALYKSLKQYEPTERDSRASGQLLADWTKLTAQSESFGRSIMTDLSPEVHHLMTLIGGVIDKNQGWLRQDIDQYVTRFGDAIEHVDWQGVGDELKRWWDYLKGIDWAEIEKRVEGFATDADSAAKAVGGWVKVAEVLFALWAGKKFIEVLANVRALAAASGVGIGALSKLLAMSRAKAGEETAEATTKTAGAASAAGAGAKAAEGATENASRVSRSASALKFAGSALKAAGLAGDAYMVGDLFWNGAEPALAKDDTLHAKPYNGPFATDNDANFPTYAASVASIEHARYDQMGGSGNAYAGKYQMGEDAIKDAASLLHTRVPTKKEFLHNPEMQERFFRAYTKSNERALYLFSSKFRQMPEELKMAVLGYAHNQGAKGARNWLNTGIAKRDGFGTYADRYSNLFLSNLKESRGYVPDRLIIEPKTNAPRQDYDQNSFSGAVVASIVRQKPSSPETSGSPSQFAYVKAMQKSMGTLDSLAAVKGSGDTSNTITNNINIHAPNSDPKAIAREARNAFDSVTFRARQANIRLT